MGLHLKRLCLLLLISPMAGLAQEGTNAAVTEREPSKPVETQAVKEEAVLSDRTAERDALEPKVASVVLAADSRRSIVGNRVMDEMDLARTEITGNLELPKVLYIVPWKKADPGDLLGRPVNTLLDEVLAPIDRTEFIRQIDYYSDLYGKEEE